MPKKTFIPRSFCFICGGSNDGIGDVCTRPACLAKYWRDAADVTLRNAQDRAKEYRATADRIELDAVPLAGRAVLVREKPCR